MNYCTHICRQDVLDTIMGCSQTFLEIKTDPRFVIFHRQIQAEHDKLQNDNFSLFKKKFLFRRFPDIVYRFRTTYKV